MYYINNIIGETKYWIIYKKYYTEDPFFILTLTNQTDTEAKIVAKTFKRYFKSNEHFIKMRRMRILSVLNVL